MRAKRLRAAAVLAMLGAVMFAAAVASWGSIPEPMGAAVGVGGAELCLVSLMLSLGNLKGD